MTAIQCMGVVVYRGGYAAREAAWQTEAGGGAAEFYEAPAVTLVLSTKSSSTRTCTLAHTDRKNPGVTQPVNIV